MSWHPENNPCVFPASRFLTQKSGFSLNRSLIILYLSRGMKSKATMKEQFAFSHWTNIYKLTLCVQITKFAGGIRLDYFMPVYKFLPPFGSGYCCDNQWSSDISPLLHVLLFALGVLMSQYGHIEILGNSHRETVSCLMCRQESGDKKSLFLS